MNNNIDEIIRFAFLSKKYDSLIDLNLKNSHKTFRYEYGSFYSYNTLIAKFYNDTLFIKPFIAKYNRFISNTTSKHILKIERYYRS